MEYRHVYAREPRITLPSLLLLAVFISAAAFIVSAIVWQPWNAGAATVALPATDNSMIVEPASSAGNELDVLVQPPTE